MGKVFMYPTAYYADGNTLYYKKRDADECISELRLENERLEEDVRYLKQESIGQVRFYNGLYQAIVKNVEPFFPKDTRELEWDVLPSTMYRLAKENAKMKELLMKMNFEVSELLKNMRD